MNSKIEKEFHFINLRNLITHQLQQDH